MRETDASDLETSNGVCETGGKNPSTPQNGEYEGWADGGVACRACFGAGGFVVNPALLQLVLQVASKVTMKK